MATDARQARSEATARLTAEIAEAERQERERLAEALHDDALQRLVAARQDLAGAGEDPGLLRSVQRQLDELTESLHAVTRSLRGSAPAVMGPDSGPMAAATVPCTLPVEDRHAQRTLEELLRSERRWSEALVAAMQDGFLVFRDGVAAQVNDRLCAMTGFTREELVGGAAGPGWPFDAPEDLDALVHDARAAGGTERRTHVTRGDGSRFPALIAARAIPDRAGGHAGLLVTVKDLTALEEAAERRRLELELGAVVASTNRLRALLDAARAVVDEDGLDVLLGDIARTISEDLGWAVVINLYRPAWDDFVVATGHGIAQEGWDVLSGATYQWMEWTPLLDERYERRGAYLVPAGEPTGERPETISWSPPLVELEGPDAWRADDVLLIPFCHSQGHFLGILSLDAPKSGRRPSDAELDVLVALASHAALAVQHAQTAIETARHAAALDRLLQVSSRIAGTREVGPMLELVAQAVTDALGFERVLIEVLGPDGRLHPQAGRDTPPGAEAVAAPLEPDALAPLLDPAFAIEGCFLLGRDEAQERMPEARRALLGSRMNGRGWRAWDDHVVLVPLYGIDDVVVGVLWVDDPVDRLLPGNERLQALHAFANQATAAMIAAERYTRLEVVSGGDPLTQLGNRRAFLRELDREVARTAREGGASMLVLADIADCVTIASAAAAADGTAHSPGLSALAEAFEAELRRHDRAFRIDGTLFAMLLTGGARSPETTAVTRRVAARLRALGAREGVRVHFGTAAIGTSPEAPDVVFHRAALNLLAARNGNVVPIGASALTS